MFDPRYVVLVGLGAKAFALMQAEFETALAAALVCRIKGVRETRTHHNESEPISRGLTMKTLNNLDQTVFAMLEVRSGARR